MAADEALYARFLRGLDRSATRPAVSAGAETITYEGAHELALHWAGTLLRAAPQPPAAVGVLAAKGVPAYVGILAALYSGAAVVPLRPDFPAARTRQMLAAAGVTALIVDGAGAATLPEVLDSGTAVAVLDVGGDGGPAAPWRTLTARHHALDRPVPVAPDDPAYVLFTSGSTGRPKGVPITHASLAHYFRLLDGRYDFTPQDVFSQTFDLNFDCAMFDLFCAWGAGAGLVHVPATAFRDLPSFLARCSTTVWFATPSSIALVRRMGGLAPGAMPTLRWSFFAGEALTCQDAADWQQAARHSIVENLYGPTELTITVTAHRWCADRSRRLSVNGVVPIGTVHDGHDHLLLAQDGRVAQAEGELCVTGPQLTAGYLDPADDRGRFVRRGGRVWYRSGDRVRRTEDGELAYLGRLDSQVQVQGLRVELAEIDHALRTCAGVDDAVTVAVPTDAGTELVACYTGTPVRSARFARQLRVVLPQSMIPRHYLHIGEFPLNPNRKIDRSELSLRAHKLLST